MTSPIKQLTQTPMSRKQFLIRVGAIAVAITGLPYVIKSMSDAGHNKKTVGYGSSTYGGDTKRNRIG